MAEHAERAISKRRRIISPISSSSEEDESVPSTSNLGLSTETSASRGTEMSGLANVVKDLVRTMELQANTSQRLLHPRDNVVPAFNPGDRRQSIEKWCQRIDELKNLYNWSDEVTVYSAVSKLEGLAKTWYGSLPTINYSWEEWKIELRRAFPPRRDFHESLQEMMRRVKQRNEPYMVYYYEKVALMNECKIYGLDAVSCMLGGISDPAIQAAARASNYATCDELVNFLKSYDIPQPSTSRAVPTYSFKEKQKQFKQLQFSESKGKVTCFRCQTSGHKAADCRTPQCHVCRKYGHRTQDCRLRQQSKNSNTTTVTQNIL